MKYFVALIAALFLAISAPEPAKAGVSVYTPWGGFSYSGPRRYYVPRYYSRPYYAPRRYYGPRYPYYPRRYYGPRYPNTFWECNEATCWEKFPGY